MNKKQKKELKKQLLKEGGKSAWKEFSTMRRTVDQMPSTRVVESKKKKDDKYKHSYKKYEGKVI